ncbi:MAG: aspartate carbamoyltransferase [Sulfolobales archaeon]|nr:aspartate carbamoyltransferase [Sulfolobales archaeon]MDW8082751.1 aspartate carbamoyltransferase [Sulfolobales archaeon]
MGSLRGRDVLSAFDFNREDLFRLFDLAERLRGEISSRGILDYARGRVMVTAFFEPSTRTKISFQFAMARLGGEVVDFIEEASSIRKGETEEDTMRILDGYSPDVIVVRHSRPFFPHSVKDIVKAPIINGGDGTNEHPTQALLDVYTIWREFGRVDGICIGILGDLKYGRTAPSLSYILTRFNDVTIYYIAPRQLQVREEVLKKIEGRVRYHLVESVEEIASKLDVLYVTRLQKERFEDPQEYERLKGSYIITRNMLEKHRKIPMIMHPLPRVGEITTDVDTLPQAKYFEQAKNGMYVRAALLKEVLGV